MCYNVIITGGKNSIIDWLANEWAIEAAKYAHA